MARSNDIELGFIKPHAGIHSGILSATAGEALGQAISLANQSVYKRSPHMNFLNQSMDEAETQRSYRPNSRYSRMSRHSRYDDDTVSVANKRMAGKLPRVSVDRQDLNYNKLITDTLSIGKKSNISKSAVEANKQLFHRIPS